MTAFKPIIDKDMRAEFPALGKCMYCGSTSELSREHIIPYGLGGPGVMPKSSCSECADLTSKFEREVLKGPLLGLRAYMRLSRRKKLYLKNFLLL